MFGPRNKEEELIFAEEGFVVDFQHALFTAMNKASVDNAELAKRLGVTKEEVDAVFESECNISIRFAAKAFHVLGYKSSMMWEKSK